MAQMRFWLRVAGNSYFLMPHMLASNLQNCADQLLASHLVPVNLETKQHVCITVLLQALSYMQGSKTRYLVKLQLHEPASSSMPALLQLKEGKAAAAAAAARAALVEEEHHAVEHSAPAHSRHSNGSGDSDAEHGDGPEKMPARTRGPPEPQESL
jgi:hypothetical protein